MSRPRQPVMGRPVKRDKVKHKVPVWMNDAEKERFDRMRDGQDMGPFIKDLLWAKDEGRLIELAELEKRAEQMARKFMKAVVPLDLNEAERVGITKLAEEIGLDGPEDLLKLLARQVLKGAVIDINKMKPQPAQGNVPSKARRTLKQLDDIIGDIDESEKGEAA